ncbi:hypothetical protein BRARA_B03846 [Brassica rapa]|uniref:HSF-type DNA-binding domain-containing protein n=1 Tax=Brassica campestris TaxID=3711 RepID=A0A398ANR8_BRACM|nr:hypothetical protein BRARA_B03846 [Brassica rapa]
MAGKINLRELSSSSSPPKAGRVKEYYRYPAALEAFNKGRVRRYFADVLYEMVNDPSTDSIVSWSQDGKSFIFWDQDKFCNDVLPKYGLSTSPTFIGRLHKIYISKFRILNMYFGLLILFERNLNRFRKVEESEHCEYANDYFVRGKPELTVEIEKQFKERCASVKLDIKPPEPGYKEKRERMRALMLAQKAARRLSLKE